MSRLVTVTVVDKQVQLTLTRGLAEQLLLALDDQQVDCDLDRVYDALRDALQGVTS